MKKKLAQLESSLIFKIARESGRLPEGNIPVEKAIDIIVEWCFDYAIPYEDLKNQYFPNIP